GVLRNENGKFPVVVNQAEAGPVEFPGDCRPGNKLFISPAFENKSLDPAAAQHFPRDPQGERKAVRMHLGQRVIAGDHVNRRGSLVEQFEKLPPRKMHRPARRKRAIPDRIGGQFPGPTSRSEIPQTALEKVKRLGNIRRSIAPSVENEKATEVTGAGTDFK